MNEREPLPAPPLDEGVSEQCDALATFYLTHTYPASARVRRPRMVEALLRCRRQLGHSGSHRHLDVRQFDDEHVDGWIDEAVDDDE